MKRTIALLLLACLVFSMASCGQTQPPATTTAATTAGGAAATTAATTAKPAEKLPVTLWATGSQNVSDMFTKALAEYNALPEAKAKMTMQFLLAGSGDTALYDRLAAAYQAGKKGEGFDLIAENSTSLTQYIAKAGSDDVFLKLDLSQIPNYKDVLVKSAYNNEKCVPYRGTTVVFAYDSERVPTPPKTWDELEKWIAEHPGRFSFNYLGTGGAGSGFGNTAVYRFLPDEAKISTDEKWKEQWGPGFEFLARIHPNMYKSGGAVVYPNKNQGTLDLLINKEVDIIPAWADQVLTNINNGTLPKTTKIYQLDDYALSGTDVVFVCPSIGANQEGSYDFINYMISPAGQKLCLETIMAVPVIDPSKINSDMKDMVSGIDLSKFSIISIGDLAKQLEAKWIEEIVSK